MSRIVGVDVLDREEWLSTGEAARRLGRSSQWTRALVRSGRLSAVETPLGLLIAAASVRAFAESAKA